ncbi:hypothetical protein [Staphylococcus pasteuri]|uniref:hypothetical protein n=1 Tax=Staphylococcus pasteuri TaxID=45972 RepID=UPI0003C0962D|nr:hypothetical protein [Staphylococcus pasteuri]AGZ26182.1 hypothetical protein STP1_1886 [Staphylococcus pasteuri SP1]
MKEDNTSKNIAILLLIGIVNLILIVSYLVIDEITNFKNAKEVVPTIISFVGLFATFGGAYLGAKISGDNARTLENIKHNQEIEDNVKRVKVLIKMNLDYISDIHMFICQYYCIERNKFLSQLIDEREKLYTNQYRPKKSTNGDFKTIEFIEKFIVNACIKKDWNKDIYREVDIIDGLIKELSRDLVYFNEKDLNIIFQLKQVLLLLKNYIYYNENDSDYSLPREGQEFENIKGVFILFSILYVDLSEKVLNIDFKKSLTESQY